MITKTHLQTSCRGRVPVMRLAALILCMSALSALLQAGCAGLGKKLEVPDVSLARIQLKEIRALESVFLIQLRVLNPNEIPLKIKGMTCELALNGKRFASGVSGNEVEIPAFGQEIVEVQVYTSVLDVFKGILGMTGAKKLRYQIKGKVKLDAGPLTPSVLPFRSEGDLSLDNLMQ